MAEQSYEHEAIVKNINLDGIVMRSSKKIMENDEVQTTEYFLDVSDKNTENVDNQAEYMTMVDVPEEQFDAIENNEEDEIVLDQKNVILWNELCRICASSSEHFMPIFDGEGQEHGLYDKIQDYLPIELSDKDALPHHVCYNCAATLISWHDLYKNCTEAQKKLRDMHKKISAKNEICSGTSEEQLETEFQEEAVDNESETQSKFEKENEIEEKPEILQEQESSRPEKRLSRIKNYRKVCQNPITKLKKCYQQDQQDKSTETLQKMKVVAEREVKKKIQASQKVSPVIKIVGMADPSVQLKKDQLSDEQKGCADIKYIVNDDDDDCFDDNNIDNDDDFPPVKEKPKARRIRNFWKKSNLTIPSNLNCTECNKKFNSVLNYEIHMRQHPEEKPFVCNLCGKAFHHSGSLYYHQKHIHEGIKKHACDLCGRCFAMKSAMIDHRRIHTGERPFVCEICGKDFTAKASLYTHSKLHSKEYAFSCAYCTKQFRWKQQMVNHLTTHTKEKNHVCDVCGKAFGVKNELTRHKMTHSSEKPFNCHICGTCFGQKRYLRNHMNAKHKSKKI